MKNRKKRRIVLVDWTAAYINSIMAVEGIEIAMAIVDDKKLADLCRKTAGNRIEAFYYTRFADEEEFLHRNETDYNLTYDEIWKYSATQLRVEHYLHRELKNDAEIQHRYLTALRFWLAFFDKEEIDMVISSGVEHGGVWDTLVFDIAKEKKIPVYVPGLMCPSGCGLITTIRDRNSVRLLDLRTSGFAHIDTEQMFLGLRGYSEHYKKNSKKINRHNYLHLIKMRFHATIAAFKAIWGQKTKEFTSDEYQYLGSVHREERYLGYAWIAHLKDFYQDISNQANYNQPYIYYPLHQEPEATIMIQAELASQLSIIDWIAESLPQGWKLYVKEHPSSFSIYEQERYFYKNISWFKHPSFYKCVKRHPNVELIHIDTPSCELIQHSRAVASICGTALTEAIAYHKPIIVFGRGISWYENLKEAHCVHSPQSLQIAITQLQGHSNPEYADVEQVVNQFAYYDDDYYDDEKMTKSGGLPAYSDHKKQMLDFLINSCGSTGKNAMLCKYSS